MLEIDSLEDIAALRESVDVECKLAQGRDGELVGHVAASKVTPSDGTPGWFGLGPVSVLPMWLDREIGSALVTGGLISATCCRSPTP